MSEKTEQPTQKKRRDARKDGDISHSEDVVQLLTAAGFIAYLSLFGPDLMAYLSAGVALQPDLTEPFRAQLAAVPEKLLWPVIRLLAVFLGLHLFFSVFANLVQKGPAFTTKKIVWDLKGLNIVSNTKEIFSSTGVVNLLKNIMKTCLLVGVGIFVFLEMGKAFFNLIWQETQNILPVVTGLMMRLLMLTVIFFIPLAVIDFVWQQHKTTKKLKMDKEEIKKESKETDGNPDIKGRRKELHQELLDTEMGAKVQSSSVILTNPTHFAVGLLYRPGETPLPLVTLKARGVRARLVREHAVRWNIPVVRDIALAKALYAGSRPGNYIPSELIEDVANVIAALMASQPATDEEPQAAEVAIDQPTENKT